MRDILVTAIVIVWLFYVFRRTHYGAYLWAWLSYMNPHRQCWGFAWNMPFAQIAFLVTLVSLFLNKEPKRIPWTRETILLVIFLIWMGITTSQAFFPELAWEHYTKILKIQAGTFMALMLVNTKERLRVFILVIVLSIGYYGTKGGIFTIVHGGQFRVQGPAGTFFGGNNEMALVMIMTVPLMRYLQLTEPKRWIRIGLGVAMFLTTIAAFGSQSRGALLAMGGMATLLWFKSRKKLATALLVGISLVAGLSLMPEAWWERMNTIKTYEQDQSALGRINAWGAAFNVAKNHVTGGGFEMFRPSTFRKYAPDPFDVHDVHSIYFEIMGEHGFIGFFMFMALMGLTWMKSNSIIRSSKRDPTLKWSGDLAAMMQVSIIGYATGGAFLGLAYFDYYYHLISIVVVTWILVNKPDFYLSKSSPVSNPKLVGGGGVGAPVS